MTISTRVLVCDNMAFKGDFTPVLRKHTSRVDLIELVSIGVDKIQRNFEPLKRQIDDWKINTLTDDQAKLVIYQAFVEKGFPAKLLPKVHGHYFHPEYKDFESRSVWSLSNAFTSAFKILTPVRQFQLTAKLGTFFESFNRRETVYVPPAEEAMVPVQRI